jgi:hypothetical protein
MGCGKFAMMQHGEVANHVANGCTNPGGDKPKTEAAALRAEFWEFVIFHVPIETDIPLLEI